MRPIVTIIKPSWLEVEKAIIFLMSFWVRAQMAVNKVVRAPKESIIVWMSLLFSIKGEKRISRKIPATTIVLEWSRAETGVGPSIADGSQGCSPNWADLPAAASVSPMRGRFEGFWLSMNICCRSHEFVLDRNQAMDRRNPISPMRLYKIAWRAAVLASVRPNHQPINKKDIMPTPSHPINSWKRLLAVTRMSMVIRKMSRYLKNWLMLGSEYIYHIENSIIDHVMNNATGINMSEK